MLLDVELSAVASISVSRALTAAALLESPDGIGTISVAGSLAGAGPLVLHGVGELEIDDERTAVLLLLGVP